MMPEWLEMLLWVIAVAMVFIIVEYPIKGTVGKGTVINRADDKTVEFVAKKFIQVDKRRWDVEIFRK